jgi:hypothetical protein
MGAPFISAAHFIGWGFHLALPPTRDCAVHKNLRKVEALYKGTARGQAKHGRGEDCSAIDALTDAVWLTEFPALTYWRTRLCLSSP